PSSGSRRSRVCSAPFASLHAALRCAAPGKRFQLRRLLLQVLLPLPEAGEPVHHGAVGEGALRRGDVLALPGPGLLRRRLQRAAIADRDSPRAAAGDTDTGIAKIGRLL